MASPEEKSPALEPIATLCPSNLKGSPAWSVSFSIDGQYLAVCWGNPETHIKGKVFLSASFSKTLIGKFALQPPKLHSSSSLEAAKNIRWRLQQRR